MNTYQIHHRGQLIEGIPFDSLTVQLQGQGLLVNLPHEVEADAAPDGKFVFSEDELIKYYKEFMQFLITKGDPDLPLADNFKKFIHPIAT